MVICCLQNSILLVVFAGYLVIGKYWYVFAQNIDGSHDLMDDAIQLWTMGR